MIQSSRQTRTPESIDPYRTYAFLATDRIRRKHGIRFFVRLSRPCADAATPRATPRMRSDARRWRPAASRQPAYVRSAAATHSRYQKIVGNTRSGRTGATPARACRTNDVAECASLRQQIAEVCYATHAKRQRDTTAAAVTRHNYKAGIRRR